MYEKWKPIEKFSIIVNTLVRSHICSYLLMRLVTWLRAICVWLDWIDHWRFILDYELIHTWYPHTTHKSNVQWISISFMWLYVFKCDVCMLNCLMIKPKKIFEYFLFVSGSDFCLFGCESFSENVKFFVLKNFVFSHFVTPFASSSKSWDFLDISIS